MGYDPQISIPKNLIGEPFNRSEVQSHSFSYLFRPELITSATNEETPGSTYGPYALDHFMLEWIIEGSATSVIGGKLVQVGPGTVIFGRPTMQIEHRWGKNRVYHSLLVFRLSQTPKTWPPIWPTIQELEPENVVFPLWRYILGQSREDPMISFMLEQILQLFVTGKTGTSPSVPKVVEEALTYIQEQMALRPSEALRLEEVARRVGVSEQHLCRIFKESVGESPMHCAQMLRLERAKKLLDETELSIAEISDMFAYSSQFHFSRNFKLSYGMSPSAYRKAYKEEGATRPASLLYRHHRVRQFFRDS